jgi:hypothetical protein
MISNWEIMRTNQRLKHSFGLLLLLTVASFQGCVDPYFPPLDGNEKVLVVDGSINNEAGPYTIKLYYTSSIYGPTYEPVPGAEVIISDDAGQSESLEEIAPGQYQSRADGIQGQVGRAYQLQIQTTEGVTYQSSWETLPAPIEIDSVYPEVAYQQSLETSYDLAGYQFYLDSKAPPETNAYVMWNLEATYQYMADFFISFVYDQNGQTPFRDSDKYMTCWRTYQPAQWFTQSISAKVSPGGLDRFPLQFIDTEGPLLAIRYSLLVRQQVLSEPAFRFWDDLRKQAEDQGELYARQPYQIRGNVKNEANPDEVVLGYFFAAGLAEKRIFVDPPAVDFHIGRCALTTENLGFILRAPGDWPIYMGYNDEGVIGVAPGSGCLDCRERGGAITPPDFWEE